MGGRQWLFPCQVPQRRMASFYAQPEGPGLFLRDAALLDAYLAHQTSHLAPCLAQKPAPAQRRMKREQALGSGCHNRSFCLFGELTRENRHQDTDQHTPWHADKCSVGPSSCCWKYQVSRPRALRRWWRRGRMVTIAAFRIRLRSYRAQRQEKGGGRAHER